MPQRGGPREGTYPPPRMQLINANATAGLHNMRPAGHMRPVRAFLEARESFLTWENVVKVRLRIIKLSFQNFFQTTTKQTFAALGKSVLIYLCLGAFWVVQACARASQRVWKMFGFLITLNLLAMFDSFRKPLWVF